MSLLDELNNQGYRFVPDGVQLATATHKPSGNLMANSGRVVAKLPALPRAEYDAKVRQLMTTDVLKRKYLPIHDDRVDYTEFAAFATGVGPFTISCIDAALVAIGFNLFTLHRHLRHYYPEVLKLKSGGKLLQICSTQAGIIIGPQGKYSMALERLLQPWFAQVDIEEASEEEYEMYCRLNHIQPRS